MQRIAIKAESDDRPRRRMQLVPGEACGCLVLVIFPDTSLIYDCFAHAGPGTGADAKHVRNHEIIMSY